MTQRKQDIAPFDELKITIPDSPRQGFDYKIASHVDLKFDFSVLYDTLDNVVETRHEQVNQAFQGEK